MILSSPNPAIESDCNNYLLSIHYCIFRNVSTVPYTWEGLGTSFRRKFGWKEK